MHSLDSGKHSPPAAPQSQPGDQLPADRRATADPAAPLRGELHQTLPGTEFNRIREEILADYRRDLQHPELEQRARALVGLIRFGEEVPSEAVGIAHQLLDTDLSSWQLAPAELVGVYRGSPESAVRFALAVSAALPDAWRDVLWQLENELGEAHSGAAELCCDALRSDIPAVARVSAILLGRIGRHTDRSIPALTEILQSADPGVRLAAERSISTLRGGQPWQSLGFGRTREELSLEFFRTLNPTADDRARRICRLWERTFGVEAWWLLNDVILDRSYALNRVYFAQPRGRGIPLAAAFIEDRPELFPSSAYVASLAVVDGFRGRGVGGSLLGAIEADVRRLGYHYLVGDFVAEKGWAGSVTRRYEGRIVNREVHHDRSGREAHRIVIDLRSST